MNAFFAAFLSTLAIVASLEAAERKVPSSSLASSNISSEPVTISTNLLFQDRFVGKLDPGWHWLREHKDAWRVSRAGLEVLIEPGNMWGPQNDARNLLIRPAPEPGKAAIEVAATVENAPTNQYEQADLTWYLDDSNMVKIGEELVDGRLSVVMGREENDRTRTVSITPLDSTRVRLRLHVESGRITGSFQAGASRQWQEVGSCELPKSPKPGETPKIALQFYQGAPGVEHWARVTDFEVTKLQRP